MIEEFEGDLLVSVLQLLSRIISMEQYTCYINIRFFSPCFRFKSPPKNDRFRATLLLLFTSVSANCKLCCGSDLAKKKTWIRIRLLKKRDARYINYCRKGQPVHRSGAIANKEREGQTNNK